MATETTLPTRLRIVELKQQKRTHAQVGAELNLSESCVKKHWCRFGAEGLPGLRRRSRRPKRPHPNQTPPAVRSAILEIKRHHPGWGGQFIQGELRRRHIKPIPHRRTIERYLNQFPDLPKRRYRQHAPRPDSHRATRWHQLWQMDFKVKEKLKRARHSYSFLNLRDMASAGSILNYTLPKGRSDWTSREVIQVCQQAFRKWHCLPEAIRTDNGTCFTAHAPTSFPTDFTLYLWGLGVEHERIDERRPTQNGGIERDQRTFGEHFVRD